MKGVLLTHLLDHGDRTIVISCVVNHGGGEETSEDLSLERPSLTIPFSVLLADR